MQPVATAADVSEDEGDVGVTARQRAELDRVGRFLSRPVAAAVLPNVLEDGNAPLQRQGGDRIEQPVGAGRPFVVKVRVDVDQHCPKLGSEAGAGEAFSYFVGVLRGGTMETMASRARGVLFEPRATFKEVEAEFTKPGAIWGKYILP